MNKFIWIFLRDRLSGAVAYFLNFLVILLFVGLVDPSMVQESWSYLLLLTVSIYLAYLIFDFFRWAPSMRELQSKRSQNTYEGYSHYEDRGTQEQQYVKSCLTHLYQLAIQKQQEIQQIHDQHVEFIHLWIHQMKLPVSNLSLSIQQAHPQGSEEKKKWSDLSEEVEKLNEGLDMALAMARLAHFSIDYQIRPISLLEQVREVIRAKKNTWIRSAIFPKIIAEEKEWTILTDPKWHRFVLEQIIQNAVKYTAQYRPQSSLTFTFHKSREHLSLSIQDQGSGIPREDLPRLYDPFFTGENGRKFAGSTGMGLYLVKKVCDQLGHQVQISSERGKGTTVTLRYQTSD